MSEFRVIDLHTKLIDPAERIVTARSPEHAAEVALGLPLVRGGAKQNLRARVYYRNSGGPLNMVRLYSKVENSRAR